MSARPRLAECAAMWSWSAVPAERKIKLKRWARRLALGAVAAELVYVGAANVILRTHILRHWVSHNPAAVVLDYDDAWSAVPFVVHIKNLTLRGQDDNVQWFLRIDEAHVHVVLRDLLVKRFQASSVQADGVTFHFRFRLDKKDALPVVVAALPDIEGFANPPLKAEQPSPPDNSAPWKVDLENVDATHTREVWVHSMRYSGESHVTGRFFMSPARSLDVGPAHVTVQSLDAAYGHASVVEKISGQADVTIENADLRGDGPQILHALTVHGAFDGEVHTGLGLSELLNIDGLTLIDGKGPIHVDAAIEAGFLKKGAAITAEPRGLSGRYKNVNLKDALHLKGAIEMKDARDVARASLSGTDVELTRDRAHASVGAATLAVEGTQIDLANKPFSDTTFDLDVHDGKINDIALWLARDDVHTKTMHVDGHARYVLPAKDASGTGDVKVDGAHAKYGDFSVDFAATSHVIAHSTRTEKGDGVSFSASFATIRDAILHDEKSSSAIVARAAEVSLEVPSLSFAKGEDTKGSVVVHAPRIEFTDSPAWSTLIGLPENLRFLGGTAVSSANGDFDLATQTAQGVVDVRAPQIAMKIGDRTMTGDLHAHAIAKREGLKTDLATSIVTFNAPEWWISLSLPRAHLVIKEPLFFAHIEGRAKDASPAGFWANTALNVPDALGGGFRDQGLALWSDLHVTPKIVVVNNTKIQDGPAYAKVVFANENDTPVGGALLSVEAVHIAVDLGKGASLPIPPGAADAFFDKKEAAIGTRVPR